MKILNNKSLLVLLIVVNLALTFHESAQETMPEMREAEIVASAYSSQQQIMALLTKSGELKLYEKTKQNYNFIQKVPTCSGSSLTISNTNQNGDAVSQRPNLTITVKCANDQAIYEFDSKSKNIKEVTVKKFILQALESLMGNVPLRTTRLLANATLCNVTYISNATNSTVCGDGNIKDGDGCSANCMVEYCGDAITNNNGEQCDDGNSVSGDGCFLCKLECGDGILNPGEQCDDGNKNDGDGCTSTCKKQTSAAALPLALGIPVVVVALLGVIIAKCILGKSAATGAAHPGQPGHLEMEESTKVLNN